MELYTLGFLLFYSFVQVASLPKGPITWCVISKPEYDKCEALNLAIQKDADKLQDTHNKMNCIQRANHDECMILLDAGKADLVVLDPNEVFVGGRHFSLVPIMKEIYEETRPLYYAVAVIKKGNLTHVHSMEGLRDTIACFPSVSSMGGWVIPIGKLISSGAMEVIDCNNYVKSASNFFGGGCAVNILTDKYNPLGDNNQKLCSACGSDLPGQHCTSQDLHAGYEGAFHCLLNKGDIAFVKHNTISRALKRYGDTFGYTENDFELMCEDGTRSTLKDFENCNWGIVPSSALMTTSAKTPRQRKIIQEFMKQLISLYGQPVENSENPDDFHLFESAPKYGPSYDLLFSDETENLVELAVSQQNFKNYLAGGIMTFIEAIRSCPVKKMVLCVTSVAEYSKCLKMKTALQAQLLKPEMECMKGDSSYDCMGAIHRREADVSIFEAGDVYSAGLNFQLAPIMAEQYNLPTTHFYSVAVSKEDDPDTDVLWLKNRRTCHPGVMHGGGWVIPMAYLINNNLIRQYGCNSILAASEYFIKSCAPGSLSSFYRHGLMRLNLCHLCQGTGANFCSRDHSEPFFGYTGAFRCLVEGGGDIAFVKHTTVRENVDGRKKEWWIRNQLTADYQLVCRDGTRAPVTDYERCNLGLVRSNAVVTRGGYYYNETEVKSYINLFLYAQQMFGRDSEDEWNFKMFYSDEPYADLIFQDATQQLVPLPEHEHHYHPFLGQEFLIARRTVDCAASASIVVASLVTVAVMWLVLQLR